MPIAAVRTSCFLLYSRNVLQIAVNGAEVSRVANLGLLLCPIIDSLQSLIRVGASLSLIVSSQTTIPLQRRGSRGD